MQRFVTVTVMALVAATMGARAWAQADAPQPPPSLQSLAEQATSLKVAADTVWVVMAAVLVFFMQAGFAYVEAGFTRAKNATNILTKNLVDFAVGSLAYWVLGFGLMFGAGNGFLGLSGFLLNESTPQTFDSLSWSGVPLMAKYLFQLVFAATAATIVSGAMAERTKFKSYLVYCVAISAFVYPISGHWIWGGGWLAKLGMWDFAGSTVVHSLGGWLALVGAWMLGPRIGKYDKQGRAVAIPGHSLPMATLGTFVLWMGWFGFNPGSTMAADPDAISHIAVTTNLAAAAGALVALVLSWGVYRKPDLGLSLNGALAGLVAITAGCAFVSPLSSVVIGAVAGAAMLVAVRFFDSVHIDDPVGAISVHGVCGALGTLAVGLLAQEQFAPGTTGNGLLFGGGLKLLAAQATGVAAVFGWAMVTGAVIFGAVRAAVGLRVEPQEEIDGLDMHEHGAAAYSEIFVQPFGGSNGFAIPLQTLQETSESPDTQVLEPISVPSTPMALLTAIIRPQELERVRQALAETGVMSLTATEVRGSGRQGGIKEVFRGVEYTVSLLPKIRLDIVVAEEKVQQVAGALMSAARTGAVGDGKVFVTPVADAMRIRTGERGVAAV